MIIDPAEIGVQLAEVIPACIALCDPVHRNNQVDRIGGAVDSGHRDSASPRSPPLSINCADRPVEAGKEAEPGVSRDRLTEKTEKFAGELEGKRAVVTGGSRGIGAAIVQKLLDAGATVVTSARNPTEQTPSAAKFVRADLSTPDGVREFADIALENLGGVDIIVNNAGGCRTFQSALDIEKDWQYTVDINFLAAVRLNSALVPSMRESGGGVVVHVSSIATIASYPMILHYAAAKSALETYNKGLAAELAPQGIRVVALSLGNVMTPGADEAREKIVDYLGNDSVDWSDEIPLGRIGRSDDIAEAVGFLVSERAAWITGSTLVIDGGRSAALS